MSENFQEYGAEEFLARIKEDRVSSSSEMDEISSTNYGDGPQSLMARWKYYTLAEDRIDFHERAIEESGMEPNNTVLDVGCGLGTLMLKLRDKYNHAGPIIGLDSSRNMFLATKKQEDKDEPQNPLNFIQSSAEGLPIATDSVDSTFAMFMLYHVPTAGKVLEEMSRVTKPGGNVVIATSGEKNKWFHRKFESNIANFLDIYRPRPFSAFFDNEVAEQSLPLFFDNVRVLEPQICDAVVTNKETLRIYLGSLESMRKDYSTDISDKTWNEAWAQAIGAVVMPRILYNMESKGSFRDTIDRHLYICSND